MNDPPEVTSPVSIISPTHATGVAMVASQAFLSVLLLLGVGKTYALTDLLDHRSAEVLIPIVMLLSSCGALLAIVSVGRVCKYDSSELLRASLRMELVCKAILAMTTLLYAYALTSYYGFFDAPNIATYVWFTGVGFAVRTLQIARDLRSVVRAQKAGLAANPPPLGQSDQG